jgi:hypothetical protein
MSAARAFAAIFAALACACTAATAAAPSGEEILLRAKAAFHAHARPPYVVYTLERRDRHNGIPDLENSYELRIWCRASDRNALLRRAWNGVAYGALINETILFDRYVDPGPPTADIFERGLFGRAPPAPTPDAQQTQLPTIGAVTLVRDYDYRVTRRVREGDAWHLSLAPIRDPERNRIDDLWIDATTYEIRRMLVRDHLYLGIGGDALPDEFDVRFTLRDGVPLITRIVGRTAYDGYETDYTFHDIAFPPTLPSWYFDPKTYGAHRDDAPR